MKRFGVISAAVLVCALVGVVLWLLFRGPRLPPCVIEKCGEKNATSVLKDLGLDDAAFAERTRCLSGAFSDIGAADGGSVAEAEMRIRGCLKGGTRLNDEVVKKLLSFAAPAAAREASIWLDCYAACLGTKKAEANSTQGVRDGLPWPTLAELKKDVLVLAADWLQLGNYDKTTAAFAEQARNVNARAVLLLAAFDRVDLSRAAGDWLIQFYRYRASTALFAADSTLGPGEGKEYLSVALVAVEEGLRQYERGAPSSWALETAQREALLFLRVLVLVRSDDRPTRRSGCLLYGKLPADFRSRNPAVKDEYFARECPPDQGDGGAGRFVCTTRASASIDSLCGQPEHKAFGRIVVQDAARVKSVWLLVQSSLGEWLPHQQVRMDEGYVETQDAEGAVLKAATDPANRQCDGRTAYRNQFSLPMRAKAIRLRVKDRCGATKLGTVYPL